MENIDLKKLSEPIPIDHVDFRVGLISEKGWMTTLAYKNARVDMDRLDEVCGPGGWQRDHKEIKGNLFCGVAIKINNRWVWKWDAGSESNMEKQKGEASDSFKRACVNWGLGRDLYLYPLILIQLKPNEFKTYKNPKGKMVGQATYDLRLKEWKWSKEGNDIKAVDESGIVRFKYKSGRGYGKLPTSKNPTQTTKKEPSDLQIAMASADGCKVKDLKSLEIEWDSNTKFHNNTEYKEHIKKIKAIIVQKNIDKIKEPGQ